MIKSFILRLISIDDLNDLRSISIETFKQTFAAQNTRENIRLYLKNKISIKQLKKEICDPNSKFYFIPICPIPMAPTRSPTPSMGATVMTNPKRNSPMPTNRVTTPLLL